VLRLCCEDGACMSARRCLLAGQVLAHVAHVIHSTIACARSQELRQRTPCSEGGSSECAPESGALLWTAQAKA